MNKRTVASELEDHLHSFKFHTNGLCSDDQTSMLGTYMGVIHYERVAAAVAALPDPEKWLAAAEVWDHDLESTGSPTFGILAGEVRRQVAKLQK